mmetsp:Transcript_92471/g.238721  ORF Transcript_92471/g.238721 Transcript_92471/m.238721 type:complete len:101 (+) Transcript_92471:434-736(+)
MGPPPACSNMPSTGCWLPVDTLPMDKSVHKDEPTRIYERLASRPAAWLSSYERLAPRASACLSSFADADWEAASSRDKVWKSGFESGDNRGLFDECDARA